MRAIIALICLVPGLLPSVGQPAEDLLAHGEGISLAKAIPANERGITCLTADDRGRVFGGTTGRAAHLFVYDPAKEDVRSLVRFDGGIGFAYTLIRLPDGSLIGGTQADPTGIATKTEAKAVGHLYRFTLTGELGASAPDRSNVKVEDLGVAVVGQGIYTLAFLEKSQEIVGNTWPDGHFFVYDLKTKRFKDHGAIAGYRPFETPQHAAEVSRATGKPVRYPRQVSRAIAVDAGTGAYTAGAEGWLHFYEPGSGKLEKLDLRLPAAAGREAFASFDAAVIYPRLNEEGGNYACLLGGTAEGHLVELRIHGRKDFHFRTRGKALSSSGVQGLIALHGQSGGGGGGGGTGGGTGGGGGTGQGMRARTVLGVGGTPDSIPRTFRFSHGGSTSSVVPGSIPRVDGQPSMVGFGAMIADDKGNIYAGESDRIARLVRFSVKPTSRGRPSSPLSPSAGEGPGVRGSGRGARAPLTPDLSPPKGRGEPETPRLAETPKKLPCHITFAPAATTTDGSGYTAIEVGKDGQVYVGSARYGDYGCLLRFVPNKNPLFMDKVADLRELTGERLSGINTQAKIHAKIVVGPDGRIWFASKQGHEVFDTRPEYDDPNGYPGGHLCWFDPKTGFSKSVGILKKREGLQGGVIDDRRGKIYLRSEPKNHFLVYDIASGEVQDRGHVGAACRYMAIDKNGVVYTMGRGQTLCRYDPETGYVEELPIKMEKREGEAPAEPAFAPPYVIALGPNGKLYGAGTSHPWIIEFDVDALANASGSEVVARNVAAASPSGMPVQDIHAGVFGKDGRFCYPLLTTAPPALGSKPEQHLRLMRFDPITKQVEDLGVPRPEFDEAKAKHVFLRGDGYKLDHIQGMAVGDDGTLFMMDIYPQLNVVWFPGLTGKR